MQDFFINLIKFIGFVIRVGCLLVLFLSFGGVGLIVGLVISGGAVAIFGDNF